MKNIVFFPDCPGCCRMQQKQRPAGRSLSMAEGSHFHFSRNSVSLSLRPEYMLRYITSLVLLVAFAMQTFYRAVIAVDYYARGNAYARVCENKARPQLHCNGRCQMLKKIKTEQQKEHNIPGRKAESKAEVLSFHLFFTVSLLRPLFTIPKRKVPVYSGGHVVDRSFAIFHPPRC
jgi:hypothetical protein